MSDFPYSRVHMLGIGGAGVSGLARILLQMGVSVTGSDAHQSPVTEELQKLGAQIYANESAGNLSSDTELVIHSAAVRPWHPVRRRAASLGIKELKYAQALGMLTSLRDTITIAGTHGKTSTTNLTSTLLMRAGRNPGWVVGGMPQNLPAPSAWNTGQHFVVEACEYDHSFLNLSPTVAVLHNIEPDHMDYFRSFNALKRAFRSYISRIRQDGVLIANWDDPVVRELAEASRRRVVRYGFGDDAMIRPADLSFHEGHARFTLCKGRRELADVRLPAPGTTNVINALAASAVALWLGVDPENIAESLGTPVGVRRRFELVARVKGVPIVDDYAHHPTAVRELVLASRSAFPGHRLTFVFQAHQYGRLVGFFDGFLDALSGLDRVLICRTFAARETGVVAGEPEERLAKALRERGVKADSLASFPEVLSTLRAEWAPDSAIVTVGAGDVNQVAYDLAANAGSYSGQFGHAAAASAEMSVVGSGRLHEPMSISSALRALEAIPRSQAVPVVRQSTILPAAIGPSARVAAVEAKQLESVLAEEQREAA